MEKIERSTPDLTDELVDKLAELMPDIVTESLDEDGEVVRSVDFDVLRENLAGSVVEGRRERYQFTWPGKAKARLLARKPTTKTMRPCPERSVDWDTTKNLYIEGDNLEALKIIRETYAGKVKLIYIDPPYNTGHDFIYDDDFSETLSEYAAESGDFDEEGGRLVTNLESNGRFHSDWGSMIYPRLLLARDLLSSDGAIFISIDEVEVQNLRKICDELFGAANFVGNIVWQSRTSISNDDEISLNHNHTLVYSRERTALAFGGDEINSDEYENPDNDPRGPWKPVPIDANHAGGNTVFPIRNPNTGEDYYPPNGRSWAYNPQTVEELLRDNRIAFGKTGRSAPKRKLFLSERLERGDTKTPSSLLLDAGTTKTGTEELMAMFGTKVFDYPKPVSFIKRLLGYGALRDGDIVMDFFSGSATTAHAVLEWNESHGKNVSFILVQIPENLDEQMKVANLDARKTMERAIEVLDSIGRPHVLTELSEERIRRAASQISQSKQEQLALSTGATKNDLGFRVLRVGDSVLRNVHADPASTSQMSLLDLVDNMEEGATPLDLLFQVLPKFRIPYSCRIEKLDVDGRTVLDVEDGQLLACFDEDISTATIESIARRRPLYAVFRDASFSDDSAVANLEELFKTFSPDTIRRVI